MKAILIVLALLLCSGAESKVTKKPKYKKKPTMDLTTNLVAYLDMAQNPDLGQMWDRVGVNHFDVVGTPTLVDGVAGGQALQCLGTTEGLWRASAPGMSHLAQPFTFALWYTPVALDLAAQTRIANCSEYAIILFQDTDGTYYLAHELENNDLVVANTLPVVIGQRYFVVIGFDGLHAFITVNLVHSNSSVPAGITPSITGFNFGNNGIQALPRIDGSIDEVALWRGRVLTYEEIAFLYNDGNGRTFEELSPIAACPSVPCCPEDAYGYQAADATDSEAGNNLECVDVALSVAPTIGGYLFMPSYVILTSDVPEAIIRYTIDETDPTAASNPYTGPILIENIGTIIKARAFLGNCTPGPVTVLQFQSPPFPIGVTYACDTPDHGGTWGVFVPNSIPDNHWQLQFILSGSTTIKRLEMYQLDAVGLWTTGIMWSTDEFVTLENGSTFQAMPLLVFIAAVQQWAAYQSSLGAFGAATHTWDLYGDQQFPVSGFFRLDMILDDNSRISSVIVAGNCTGVPPTPCPSPAAPTTTALCDGEVDVTFTGSIAQNYKVFVSEIGSPGGWTEVAAGSLAASPTTVNVSGLTKGALYYFRVELEYSGCGYQSSIAVAGVPLNDPLVSISSDKLVVDPNESFTISWSSNFIGGAVCGGCLDGEVGIDQGLGCKAGNAAGSQATSQATPGDYTYTITGCNTCGTDVASVVVSVRNVAICSTQPAFLTIANPTSFLCAFLGAGQYGAPCPVPDCVSALSFGPAWNGQLPLTSNCNWESCVTGAGCSYDIGGGTLIYHSFCIWCYFSVNKWVLQMGSAGGSPNGCIWSGEKLFGNSPLGTYTRIGGCATGPSSITVS